MKKLFYLVMEVIGWLRVLLSPVFAMLLIAVILYGLFPDWINKDVFIILLILGVILGVFWANHVWKKYGTINYWSKINATPELDFENKEEQVKNHDQSAPENKY